MKEYAMTINGKKVFSNETFDVINPATGEAFAKCPKASVAQLDQAVAAAKKALPRWSGLADEKRVEALKSMMQRTKGPESFVVANPCLDQDISTP